MAMTEKDYQLIALVIKHADFDSMHTVSGSMARSSFASNMAAALSDAGGLRFKTDVFLKACGVIA